VDGAAGQRLGDSARRVTLMWEDCNPADRGRLEFSLTARDERLDHVWRAKRGQTTSAAALRQRIKAALDELAFRLEQDAEQARKGVGMSTRPVCSALHDVASVMAAQSQRATVALFEAEVANIAALLADLERAQLVVARTQGA
jgi:hypothetical protein